MSVRCGAHRHHLISIEGLFHIAGEVSLGVVQIHLHGFNFAGLAAQSPAPSELQA